MRKTLVQMVLSLCVIAGVEMPSFARGANSLAIVEDEQKERVWNHFIEAEGNLNVRIQLALITGVPMIPSGNGVPSSATALTSIALFREQSSRDLSVKDCGKLALVVRQVLDSQTEATDKKNNAKRMAELWNDVCAEYRKDIEAAALKVPRQSTKGELYAKVLQNYLDRSQKESLAERLREAVEALAKARDLSVHASVEDAPWQRCQEAIIRRMPFLCFLSDDAHPLVGVGYVEDDNKKYLIAFDPEKCKSQMHPAEKKSNSEMPKPPMSEPLKKQPPETLKSLPSETPKPGVPLGPAFLKAPEIKTADKNTPAPETADQMAMRLIGSEVFYKPDYEVQVSPKPMPGMVILAVNSPTLRCLFVYNWQRDEQMVQQRVKRILNASKK